MLKLYNTLTRQAEAFTPIDEKTVRMYTCGPTVYNYAHIGNFRAYLFEDILRRALKAAGYDVVQVMNITDIDDKTIRGSQAEGKTLNDYTSVYTQSFFEDLDRLNIERAEFYPAATEHVPEMIELIQKLLDKSYAYKSKDGSIYFNVAKFAEYGKLARIDLSGLRGGARVAQDEYDKDSVADFALWKAWSEEDGDVGWDTPWGRGRPGWHIECSAMGMKYLGESFDIHTGGVDNMFPHHENEIAQAEAATGKQFVRTWLHCEHLHVNGHKMSKSLGNFYTLREIIEKGYSGREVRYVLLSGHYRQMLNFTFDSLDAARSALARIDGFSDRLKDLGASAASGSETVPDWAESGQTAFFAALGDDLNTPEALAALFAMIHAGNRAMDQDALTPGEAVRVIAVLAEIDSVLGVIAHEELTPADDMEILLEERKVARASKNWAESDRIRDLIAEQGWLVKDTPDGQKLVKS